MSDSTANPAFAAFVAACGDLSNPPKTSKVNAGAKSYHFAPLPEILDLARPVLARHALAVRFQTQPDGANILVTCEIVHATGTVVSAASLYSPSNANMQVVGSGLTYARRYTLVAALGIAADDDDDGEATTRPAPKAAPAPAPRPAPAPSQSAARVAFEASCRMHGVTTAQVDVWRSANRKPLIGDLGAEELSGLSGWLFGSSPKAAEALAQIREAK